MVSTGFLMTMKLYDSTYMRESTHKLLILLNGSNESTWNRRHHMFILTLNNKLFLAPINNPKRVMDVGTGIGIWASYGLQLDLGDDVADVSQGRRRQVSGSRSDW